MSDDISLAVKDAITRFYAAKALMKACLGVTSASMVTEMILREEIARNGRCEGFTYNAHGVGYTVTFPDGSSVHIDSIGIGDGFTAYDVRAYLEDIGRRVLPIGDVRAACEQWAEMGLIAKADGVSYGLVGPSAE